MFVEQLDRPWQDTPFPLQGIEVTSPDDIRRLRDYCQFVYIDDGMATVDPTKPQLSNAKKRHFAQQFADAKQARRKTADVVRSLQRSVRAGRKIDVDATKTLIEDLIPSLAPNAEALICLTNLKSKDQYTANHSINVCTLSLVFGQSLGLSDAELQTLGVGAILHDIGKMEIPNRILNKPAKLTDGEFEVIQRHPELGVRIITAAGTFTDEVVSIVRDHHERFGGGGYPNGTPMQQREHLYSQIVSLVDVFDALTSERVYRKSQTSEEALAIMRRGAGGQFNPDLLTQFERYFSTQASGSLIELNTGEIGIQLFSENTRPVVLLIMDGQQNRYYPLRIIDFKLFENTARPYSIRSTLPAGTHGINIGECIDQAFKI